MKKISIAILAAGLLLVSAVHAQTIQDGVKDLYAERYKSAKAAFEKLLAANTSDGFVSTALLYKYKLAVGAFCSQAAKAVLLICFD